MKADMADKEMLESSQSKYEEEVREKCSIISEQKAVRTDQLGNDTASGDFNINHTDTDFVFEIILLQSTKTSPNLNSFKSNMLRCN